MPPMRNYDLGMANQTAETEEPSGSIFGKLYRTARRRPVTTLAIAAGIGALAGAELLAAGLAGGAAVLLLQRRDLGIGMRRIVERTTGRLRELVEQSGSAGVEH
jgi:hypothetical protein